MKTFYQSKSFVYTLFLFTGLIFSNISWGQFSIFSETCSTFPASWNATNVGSQQIQQTATGGYWLLEAGNIGSKDVILAPEFDASVYSEISFVCQVATYGNGTNNALKIEFSNDGGLTWLPSSYTSQTPTSSTYINSGNITLSTNLSASMQLRLSNNGTSGRGVRIKTISLSGVANSHPALSLPTSSSISISSATIGATISSDGGSTILDRGTVYGTTTNPTTNLLTEGGITVSAFSHSRSGLMPNTLYYYRGYATNSIGTGYSPDGNLTTLPLPPTDLTSSSISQVGASLSWVHPIMGSASYSYTLQIDDDINFGSINVENSGILSSTNTFTATGLTANTTYYFRLFSVNSQGVSDFSTVAQFTTQTATSPLLTVSSSAISFLDYTYESGASISNNLEISGTNLNTGGNLLILGLSDFEVSLDDINFSSNVSLPLLTSTLNSTPIYFRLKAGLIVGSYSEQVTISGGGATSLSVALTGSVTQATPVINSLPLASAINYLEALSMSTLSGGVANTPGSFSYTNPTVVPSSGGTYIASITFTPTDAINYSSAVVSVDVTVNAIAQTITFNTLPTKVVGDLDFLLSAYSSSSLTVTYQSSNTNVATIIGNTVTIIGPGLTTITATQSGDVSYLAASAVSQILTVKEAIVKWNFEEISTTNTGNNPIVAVGGSTVANIGVNTTLSNFSASHSNSNTVWSNPAGFNSTKSLSSNYWSLNDYYQFSFSTQGYQNLTMNFYQLGSNTGPANFKISYSTNGTVYTDLINGSYNVSTSYSGQTFNLPSYLNNATVIYIRLVNTSTTSINNGTVGTGGTSRIDDFLVYGDACIETMITSQPSNSHQNALNGANVTVVASGLDLAYQWYANSTASNTGGTLISGATSSSYTPAPASNTYYYCVVTGTCGTVTSDASGVVTAIPVVTLSNASCNNTLNSMSSGISATNVPNASAYRFTLTPSSSQTSYQVTSPDRWFALSEATGMALYYGTQYSVTVEIQGAAGSWGAAGSACTVTTPSIPTPTLSNNSCGQTLTSMSSGISANNVHSAALYRFTITPGIANASSYTVDSPDRWIALTEATGMPLWYGTTYEITVAVQNGTGTWGNPGNPCTITTPSIPTPTLSNNSCGQTLTSMSSGISANNVHSAALYRFTITPGIANASSYTVDSPDRWIALTEATGMPLWYGTTYEITVAVQNGTGTWGNPGNPCTITTPSIPTPTLSNNSCGQTLTSMSSGISANNVHSAALYRFTITPGIANASSYTVDSPDRWIALTEATGMPLWYGTTYEITVAVQNGTGTWGNPGNPCTVTTPAIPTIGLSTASCGATLQSLGSGISATNVAAATQYEFEITAPNGTIYSILSPDRWIALSEGTNATFGNLVPTNNQTYYIRVRAQSGSNWGLFDELPCQLFTPQSQQVIIVQDPQLHEEQTEGLGIEESSNVNGLEENQIHNTTWTATATSNPFAHSFQIKLSGAEGFTTDASFTAQLTDMSGKVYSQATLNKEQLELESFGEQLAPGMYLMTLRQGEELRVIRVVKR